jgi:hypothetical protein
MSSEVRTMIPLLPVRSNADSALHNTSTYTKAIDWLRLFLEPGQVVELRAIRQDKGIEAGFFDYDHLGAMVHSAIELSESGRYKGIYFIFNPIAPALLSRTACTIKECSDLKELGGLTKDQDILHRRWLLIDADPQRQGTGSASDEEKARARAKVLEVRTFLAEQGWPEPILADSGNGFHLLYRIDLPADDGGLIKKVLQALGERFDDEAVQIDRLVFNPARLTKLYGTWACKGENTAERPHRLTGVLDSPAAVKPVPKELLEKLAAQAPGEPVGEAVPASGDPSKSLVPLEQKLKQARAYLAKVPGAVEGKQGDKQTYRAARILVIGFALTPEEALPLLLEWNKTCKPPWPEAKLRRKLEKALDRGGHRGKLLTPDGRAKRKCKTDEQAALARSDGSQSHNQAFAEFTNPLDPPVNATKDSPAFLLAVPDFIQWDARSARPTLPPVRLDRKNRRKRSAFLSPAWVKQLVRHAVIAQRCNVIVMPDILFGQLLWGPDEKSWPPNWRQLVGRSLQKCQPDVLPASGSVGPDEEGEPSLQIDLSRGWRRGRTECPPTCPLHGHAKRHRHFELLLAKQDLGALMACKTEELANNYFEFDFRRRKWTRAEVNQRKRLLEKELAKTMKLLEDRGDRIDRSLVADLGLEIAIKKKELASLYPGRPRVPGLQAIYLPSRIFGPSPRSGLTPGQCALLQALTGEITRSKMTARPDKAQLVQRIEPADSQELRMPVCPYLEPAKSYVSFNGTGSKRHPHLHGHGFKFPTWLKKAGRAEDDGFTILLQDACGLVEPFGLVVAGWHRQTGEWRALPDLVALSGTRSGRKWLGGCVLRFYSESDYLTRWREYFARRLGFSSISPGPGAEALTRSPVRTEEPASINSPADLTIWMRRQGMTDAQLAARLGIGRSTVTLYRTEKRPWPATFAARLAALRSSSMM